MVCFLFEHFYQHHMFTELSITGIDTEMDLIQHFTTLYNTFQYFTILYNTLHNTVFNILQHFTTRYNTLQHSIITWDNFITALSFGLLLSP